MKCINKKYNIKSFDTIDEVFDNMSDDYFIISDENVYKHYNTWIDKYDHYIIKPGEDYKTLDTVNGIYKYLLEHGYNRTVKLLGVGGGIVTDITGYVGSTYMRGVDFGFVPTTLLAMIDAALGGKNGVNFDGYKNIIGCFKQPSFIYICNKFLYTLETREYNAGIGELLKYAIGFDGSILSALDNEISPITLIDKCIKIKMDIVDKDEKESGLRKKLNLGHTIAHAIEKYSHNYMHGEAVYIGLRYITEYSYKTNYIDKKQYSKIMNVLNKNSICDYNIHKEDFIDYITKDKKTIDSNFIDIIVPTSIGHCEIRSTNIKTFINVL